MWKDYSSDYIKHNRAVSYSIRAASFISALFLSFLCNLFYNFWLDSVQEGEKEVPHVLAAFYLIVLLLVCVSLILVIHNSFAVSMQNRIHQFGIFSTICNRLPMPMILTTPKKNLMPVKKEAMNMKAAIIKRKRRKKKIVER